MWGKIRAVWMKELLDTVRDKRTLYMMVLLPILIMPLMTLIGPMMMTRQEAAVQDVVPVAAFVGGEHVPGFIARLEETGALAIEGMGSAAFAVEAVGGGAGTDVAAQLEQRLQDGELDLVVYVEQTAADKLAAEQTVTLDVVYTAGKSRSTKALQRFEAMLEGYGAEVVEARLEQRGLAPELTRPFEVGERRDVTPERQFTAQLLGMMIPFLISVWAVAGGMYTAIDVAAGEKERNSLESLIMAPVSAGVFVVGKFLAVATVTFTAIVLLIGSMLVSMLYALPRVLGETESLSFSLTPGGILLLLAVMVLFIGLMSAVQLGLSVFSKSFREAQSYITGLMFVVMVPGMFMMFIDEVSSALWMYFVPVLNVLLIVRGLLEGTAGTAALVATFVSLALAAGIALWVTLRAFRHERALFRT